MKNKKGSHVGVVVSFVIFLTFIVFLYLLLQPSITSNTKKGFSEYLEAEIINITSGDLKRVSVRIIDPSPEDCVELMGFLSQAELGDSIKAVDNKSSPLTLGVEGSNLFIERNSALFFKVSESSEFDAATSGSLGSCQPLSEGTGYDMGLIKTDSYVFESKVKDLISDYASDYEGLKNSFNLASGDEFGVSFIYNNETEISTNEANVPLSVFISEVPVQYVNSKGGVESGSLVIRIW